MSRIETHIGTLKRLSFLSENEEHFADVDVEAWMQERCTEAGFKKEPYHESWLEAWNDEHYHSAGYIVKVKGEYYEVTSNEDFEENDIQEIVKEGTDKYRYVLRFYNGGTCFPEMLEEAINDMKGERL